MNPLMYCPLRKCYVSLISNLKLYYLTASAILIGNLILNKCNKYKITQTLFVSICSQVTTVVSQCYSADLV